MVMFTFNTNELKQQALDILGYIGDLEKTVLNIEMEAKQLDKFVQNLRDYQEHIRTMNAIVDSAKQKQSDEIAEAVKGSAAKATMAYVKNLELPNVNSPKDLAATIVNYEFTLQKILEEYSFYCNSLSNVELKACFHSKLMSIINEQRKKFKEVAAVMQHTSSTEIEFNDEVLAYITETEIPTEDPGKNSQVPAADSANADTPQKSASVTTLVNQFNNYNSNLDGNE